MRGRRPWLAVAGASLAIILGAVWAARLAVRSADAATAVLLAREGALDSRIQKMKERIAAADRDGARLHIQVNDLRSAQAASKRASNRLKLESILAGDPKVFRLWSNAFRAGLGEKYGPFYQHLGLSSGQIAEFEALLTGHEEVKMDLKATALSQGLEAADPAIAALQESEDARLRSAQVALLGDSGYEQLQQFDRLLPVRPIVDTVAFAVALTPAPLSDFQAGQLMQILADAQSGYQNGGAAGSDVMKINWDTALARAQDFLSGPQLAALRGEAQLASIRQLVTQFSERQGGVK